MSRNIPVRGGSPLLCPESGAAQAGPFGSLRIVLHRGRNVIPYALFGDGHLRDCRIGGHVVHDLRHYLLQHRAQAAGTDAAFDRLVGGGLQGLGLEFQVHHIVLQKLPVLFDQSVLGFGQDLHQLLPAQGLKRGDHRQTAHQLRNDTELEQVVGLDLLIDGGGIPIFLALDLSAKTDALLIQALLNDLLDTVKSAAADEEDVFGVDLNELLVRMLPAAEAGHWPRCPPGSSAVPAVRLHPTHHG